MLIAACFRCSHSTLKLTTSQSVRNTTITSSRDSSGLRTAARLRDTYLLTFFTISMPARKRDGLVAYYYVCYLRLLIARLRIAHCRRAQALDSERTMAVRNWSEVRRSGGRQHNVPLPSSASERATCRCKLCTTSTIDHCTGERYCLCGHSLCVCVCGPAGV